MKFRVLFLILISLFLFSCENNEEVDVFEKELMIFSEEDDEDSITKDFTLVVDVEGIEISWDSNKPEIIAIDGSKAIVRRSNQEENVTLIALYESKDGLKTNAYPLVVIADTEPPIISGIENMEIALGEEIDFFTYVKANDAVDGDVEVRIRENSLDINNPGIYEVVFEARDAAGNYTHLAIYITVVAHSVDTTPPVISGIEDLAIKLGEEIDFFAYVKAIDDVDGEVEVEIQENNLDINTPGVYKVVFAAEDSAGNVGTLSINVTVLEPLVDITPPVISGIEDLEIKLGEQIDFFAYVKAIDDVDGEVEVEIKENNLDINTPGVYKVVFTAEDSAGNIGTLIIYVSVIQKLEEEKIYIEDFNNYPYSSSSYGHADFVGNQGIIWEVNGARGDLVLDGKAITFGGSTKDNSSLKTSLSSGISYFSVDLKKEFTSNNPRIVGLFINNELVAEYSLDVNTDEVQNFEVDLDVFGDYTLELRQLHTIDSRAQITLDNIVIINNPRSGLPLEQENLNKDFSELNIQKTFIDSGSIRLPTEGVFGSIISWEYTDSSNQYNSLINLSTFDVSLPEDGVVEIWLDALLVNGDYNLVKTFKVSVGIGEPSLIKDVFNAADGQKVYIFGVVTNVFEVTSGKRFFIQDSSAGILVYLDNSLKINIGDELKIIADKNTSAGIAYLSNITKYELITQKTVTPIELRNQSLSSLTGKLINLNGLLKFSYGEVDLFTLVNKYDEFDIYIQNDLINSSLLQSKLSGKETASEVDLFGVVYLNENKYMIYLTSLSDLEIDDELNFNAINEVIHHHLDFPTNGISLSENLHLISEDDLFTGLRIEWISNNPDVLTNFGMIYPRDEDVDVTLFYKIYIAEILISENEIELTILKKSQYTGYYSTIQGLTGEALKTELNSIVSKMKTIGYSSTSYVLEDADLDPTKTNQLLLIYSRTNVANRWNSGSTWNKEHIWPQSKLGGASRSDIHNLRAANPSVNSSRGNYAFVDGTGKYGRVGSGWYPGDEDKGDVARIVLYMNVRWNLTISTNTIGNFEMFLRWHYEDPVDDFERQRNQVIYENQENRNPFIDHPELVEMVYGSINLSNNEEIVELEFFSFPEINFISINYYEMINRKRV